MKLTQAPLLAAALFFLSPLAVPDPIPVIKMEAKPAPKFPRYLNAEQIRILTMAQEIAKKDGINPQLLQGVALQESSAGLGPSVVSDGSGTYYGAMQLTIGAALDVLKAFPSLKKQFKIEDREDLIEELAENDRFNIAVASKYFLVLKRYGFTTIEQLALAYNQGPGGAKDHDPLTHEYSLGVTRQIRKLKGTK